MSVHFMNMQDFRIHEKKIRLFLLAQLWGTVPQTYLLYMNGFDGFKAQIEVL